MWIGTLQNSSLRLVVYNEISLQEIVMTKRRTVAHGVVADGEALQNLFSGLNAGGVGGRACEGRACCAKLAKTQTIICIFRNLCPKRLLVNQKNNKHLVFYSNGLSFTRRHHYDHSGR